MAIVGEEMPVNSAMVLRHLPRETRVKDLVHEGEVDLVALGCLEEPALLSNKETVIEVVRVDTFILEQIRAVVAIAEVLAEAEEEEEEDMVMGSVAAHMAGGTHVADLENTVVDTLVEVVDAGLEEEILEVNEECVMHSKRACATEAVRADFVTKVAEVEVKVDRYRQEYVLTSKKVYVIGGTLVDIGMRVVQTAEMHQVMTTGRALLQRLGIRMRVTLRLHTLARPLMGR